MANKSDLVNVVANKTGKAVADTKRMVEEFLAEVSELLLSGEEVSFRELGTFKVVTRAPRKARNPRTGESVDVGAKRVLRFKPSSGLRNSLNTAPVTVATVVATVVGTV